LIVFIANLAAPDVFDEHRLTEFKMILGSDAGSGVHH
jgi:hypothetical protein